MMRRVALTFVFSALAACGSSAGGFTIKGSTSTSVQVANLLMQEPGRQDVASTATRTVTHVMAVNPQTASPERTVSAVDSQGNFSLSVPGGRPYVVVFIDSTQVGTNMIVGIFKAESLD